MTAEEFDTARIITKLSRDTIPLFLKWSRNDVDESRPEFDDKWVWFEALLTNQKFHTFESGGTTGEWFRTEVTDAYLEFVRGGCIDPEKHGYASTLTFMGVCSIEDLPIPFNVR